MVAHWISVLMNDVLQRLRVRVLSSSLLLPREHFSRLFFVLFEYSI
jgi:hypothetical protein